MSCVFKIWLVTAACLASASACDPLTEYQCGDGSCIEKDKFCNLESDCPDASDEYTGCAVDTCGAGRTACADGNSCYYGYWYCDGELDCPDGSDEPTGCATKKPCEDGEVHCADKNQCIDETWMCDGYADCNDHSDEKGCDARRRSLKHAKRVLKKTLRRTLHSNL